MFTNCLERTLCVKWSTSVNMHVRACKLERERVCVKAAYTMHSNEQRTRTHTCLVSEKVERVTTNMMHARAAPETVPARTLDRAHYALSSCYTNTRAQQARVQHARTDAIHAHTHTHTGTHTRTGQPRRHTGEENVACSNQLSSAGAGAGESSR